MTAFWFPRRYARSDGTFVRKWRFKILSLFSWNVRELSIIREGMHEVTVLLFANDGTFKSDGIFQSDGTPCFDSLCAMFSTYFVIDYRLKILQPSSETSIALLFSPKVCLKWRYFPENDGTLKVTAFSNKRRYDAYRRLLAFKIVNLWGCVSIVSASGCSTTRCFDTCNVQMLRTS